MSSIEITEVATSDEARRLEVFQLRYQVYCQERGMFREFGDERMKTFRNSYDDGATLIRADDSDQIVGTIRALIDDEIEFSNIEQGMYLLDRLGPPGARPKSCGLRQVHGPTRVSSWSPRGVTDGQSDRGRAQP